MLKEDEIWEGAQAVWNTMPSCDIARSFVLSYRTAKEIVEVKGKIVFYQERKADCILTFGKILLTQKLA